MIKTTWPRRGSKWYYALSLCPALKDICSRQDHLGIMSTVRKRKGKNNKNDDESDKPSKQDYEIAKYLRNKCPKKQTKLFDDKVYYFIGSRAVDTLLESPWSKAGKKTDHALFPNRNACVDYLNKLLGLGLFARGEKIVVKKPEKKDKKKKDGKDETSEVEGKNSKTKDGKKEKDKGKEKEKEKEKNKASVKKDAEDDKSDDESEDEPESPKSDAKESEKKKKKIRLELHQENVFLDSNDAYIWIYEPTSIKNIAIGTIIVLGSIGACLFPLWPPIVRQGVYYLSLVMVGLIGLLIGASLFRYVVFGMVWLATAGNIYFWYLPNLTEDCGFFESFVPAYSVTRKGEEDDKTKKKKDKKDKDKKKKTSDNEENPEGDGNQTAEQPAGEPKEESSAESPSTLTQRKKKKKEVRREEDDNTGEGNVVPKEDDAALADMPELEDPSNDAEEKDNDEKLRSSNSSESDTFEIVNANPADED